MIEEVFGIHRLRCFLCIYLFSSMFFFFPLDEKTRSICNKSSSVQFTSLLEKEWIGHTGGTNGRRTAVVLGCLVCLDGKLFPASSPLDSSMTSRWLLIVSLIHTCCAANLERANLNGLKSQFQTAMKSLADVASLHYTLAGIEELGVQPPDNYCEDIKRLVDKSDMESIYHATEAARTLTNCKVSNLESPKGFICLSL